MLASKATLLNKVLINLENRTPKDLIEWVAENRRVVQGAMVGQYKDVYKNPVMVGIYKDYAHFNFIALQTSVQVGKTDLLTDILCYIAVKDPSSCLVLYPDDKIGKENLQERFRPAILDLSVWNGDISVEILRTKIKKTIRTSRDRDNQFAIKNGFNLKIRTTNSKTSLSNDSIKFIAGDEIDKIKDFQLEKFLGRLTSFGKSGKAFFSSSPLDFQNSHINKIYQKGSCGTFSAKCIYCLSDLGLYYDDIKWVKTDAGYIDTEQSGIYCKHCGFKIDDHARIEGIKLAVNSKENYGWSHVDPLNPRRTFKISGLMSTFMMFYGVSGILEASAVAWAKFVDDNDDTDWQDVINEKFGEAYSLRHIGLDGEQLQLASFNLKEGGKSCPADAVVITAGVDVQDNRLEVDIAGWGVCNKTNRLLRYGLEYHQIKCPPNTTILDDYVWQKLEQLIKTPFNHPDYGARYIDKICVDYGFLSEDVYKFVMAINKRNGWVSKPCWSKVICVKGGTKERGDLVILDKPRKGKQAKSTVDEHVPFLPLRVNSAKDQLYLMLRSDYNRDVADKALRWNKASYANYNAQFMEGLLSETWDSVKKTYVYSGHTSARNEPVDLFVYSLAGLQIIRKQYEFSKGLMAISDVDFLRSVKLQLEHIKHKK